MIFRFRSGLDRLQGATQKVRVHRGSGGQKANLLPHGFGIDASVFRCLHRGAACIEHIDTCDLVAVAHRDPAQRRETGGHGESRLLLRKVPGRARQRPGVGRAGIGQLDGLVEQACVLGCREPLPWLARRRSNQIAQDGLLRDVRILLCNGTESCQVGGALVRFACIAPVCLVGETR